MRYLLALLCIWTATAFAELGPNLDKRLSVAGVEKFPGYVEVVYDLDLPGPQPTRDELDIVLVVDNSGSMHAYQQDILRLAAGMFNELLSNRVRFHLAVLTTDAHDLGSFRLVGSSRYVTESTPNGAHAMEQMADVGTSGSGQESPLAQIGAAIRQSVGGNNAGFFRASAKRLIFVITDEDDQSLGDVATFAQEMQSGLAPLAVFMTTSVPGDCPNAIGPMPRLQSLANFFPAESAPICGDFVRPAMDFLSREIALVPGPGNPGSILVPLPSEPAPDTISVTYGSQTIPRGFIDTGWLYDPRQNQIVLQSGIEWTVQPLGTRLRVRYVPRAWQP